MTDTTTPPTSSGLLGTLATLRRLYNAVFGKIESLTAAWAVPTLARLTFAGVLLFYFWGSAKTKLGDGFFGFLFPSTGAYAQIFPIKADEVLYDPTQFSIFEKLVIVAGTWAEFILPLLLVIGLITRLAALGMIGFVYVQSMTDIYGHHADATTIGAWFDRASDSLLADQRGMWAFVLIVLVLRGAGPISLDRLLIETGAKG